MNRRTLLKSAFAALASLPLVGWAFSEEARAGDDGGFLLPCDIAPEFNKDQEESDPRIFVYLIKGTGKPQATEWIPVQDYCESFAFGLRTDGADPLSGLAIIGNTELDGAGKNIVLACADKKLLEESDCVGQVFEIRHIASQNITPAIKSICVSIGMCSASNSSQIVFGIKDRS